VRWETEEERIHENFSAKSLVKPIRKREGGRISMTNLRKRGGGGLGEREEIEVRCLSYNYNS